MLKAAVPPQGPDTLIKVPLGTAYAGFGRIGTANGIYGTLSWKATHDLWHEGVVTVPTPNGTLMFAGSDARTPNRAGQLSLASYIKVTVTANISGFPPVPELFIPGVGRLTLDFVPEPGNVRAAERGRRRVGFVGRGELRSGSDPVARVDRQFLAPRYCAARVSLCRRCRCVSPSGPAENGT